MTGQKSGTRLSGETLAAFISGAWRSNPPPRTIDRETLDRVLPHILRSGSAGLVWWTIRGTPLENTSAGTEIRKVYRLQAIWARIHEHNLQVAVQFMRDSGIEPVLAKGWAVARLYPAAGIRPYGDFDVCVGHHQYAKALEILSAPGAPGPVDLHDGFRELPDDFESLLMRSERVDLGDTSFHVLSPEDHLRLLVIHMLSHGAWRPLWLCDVALFLESVANVPAFDWKRCLTEDAWTSEWVVAGIALAHRVLGARLPDPVMEVTREALPEWLTDALFEQWGRSDDHYMRGPTAAELLKEGKMRQLVHSRWPEPIEATIRRHGRMNAMPRLPFQIAEAVSRAAKLILKKL